MPGKKPVAVRLDNKCRVTLPRPIREALGVEAGDTVFLQYEPESRELRLTPAVNPFDVLAEHAVREYREGRTKDLREYAREHGLAASLEEVGRDGEEAGE